MITASYVSDSIRKMHEEAERKGILILNEIGLDPGIDHMEAIRIIKDVEFRGGVVREFISFCGGLPAPERWRELRRTALDRIWPAARGVFDATVVDVGFCLESDGETGAWARERNAAALSAVAGADHIVAVGDTSVVGAARLAGTIARLREVAPTASVSLIRNRARGSAAQWREAVGHLLPQAPVVDVPADERAVAACWARGRSLDEGARRSRIRRAMEQVAATAVSG